MSDEHPVDRYIREKSAFDESEKKVKKLVGELSHAVSRLETINWTKIQFSGSLTDGTVLKPTASEQHLIVNLNAPTVTEIYEAIEKWKMAKSETEEASALLTPEQKKALRPAVG